MKKVALLSFCCLLLFACKTKQAPTKSYYEMGKFTGSLAENAMVVSAHALASKAGVEILQKGGNAVDAAVAVHLALAVVYPRAGNIGGGGFMILRQEDGNIHTLDFREKAPKASERDMYLDDEGNVVSRLSIDGHLAVGVPGSVAGCFEAHQKYGKLDWKILVEPAIKLAEEGHMLSEIETNYLNDNQAFFTNFNTDAPYFQNEKGWNPGDTLVQEDLAQTLKFIRDYGRDGFYKGKIADLLVAEMQRGNGIITHEDLENYQPVWREPVIGKYKEDYRIISMAPPSSGGIALLQMCKMMEDFPVKKWGFLHPQTVHTMIEAERRAYADRATHLGDPDFYPVPVEGLLADNYLKQRIKDFDEVKASVSNEINAGTPKEGTSSKTGNMPKESNETTHYSIVDSWGNAVSVTTTLNSNYGSKTFVAKAGFLLNNEMDDFSAKPGVPNQFGLIGNEANAIAPHKRMLSSMTPTIVEKNGKLFMVLGSPGGATIITSVFQNILNVIEHGMSMQEAVNAPRFHHQWKPDKVFTERDIFPEATINQLKEMGHQIVERGSLIEKETIGKVDAILVRPDGTLEGAADIRGEDSALGY